MTININEIDNSLFELDVATKDHYDWVERFMRLSLLGGEGDSDILDIESHRHCRFSKWLVRNLEGETLDREMVMNIDRRHTEMHDIARALMLSILSESVTEKLVSQYHQSQWNFINSLDTYKDYLFSYRNLHDALTGLPLRHLLYEEYPLILARCARMNQSMYVLIMDIDRFKSINDTWGHNAGDDVLRSVALTLKSATRKSERIYRFGGEEFVILLEASNDEDAQSAAQRMRRYLESHVIMVDEQPISVTVTGGVTKVGAGDTLHSAIGRADKAMYYGKNTGRNRCIMSTADEQMVTLS